MYIDHIFGAAKSPAALATAFLLAGSLHASGALAQMPGFATAAHGKTACEVLNAAEAQAALGQAVARGEAIKSPAGEFSTCVYTGTDLPSNVGITLLRSNQLAETQYRMMLKDIRDKNPTAVKGLGNEAHIWFDGDNGTIIVKNGGNVVLSIGIQHGVYRPDQWKRIRRVSEQSLRALAEAALPRTNQTK